MEKGPSRSRVESTETYTNPEDYMFHNRKIIMSISRMVTYLSSYCLDEGINMFIMKSDVDIRCIPDNLGVM